MSEIKKLLEDNAVLLGAIASVLAIFVVFSYLSAIIKFIKLIHNYLKPKVKMNLKVVSPGTISIDIENKTNTSLKIKKFVLESNGESYLIKKLSGKELVVGGILPDHICSDDVFGYHPPPPPFYNAFIGKVKFYLTDDTTNKIIPVSVKRKTIIKIKKELEQRELDIKLELELHKFLGHA